MFSSQTSQVSNNTLYVEDVFSAYTRTGTGASATVTTGVDLSTRGGLVISKGRSGVTDWAWYDTARGATYDLVSNSTAAQTTQAQGLTAFGTTGHTWGTLAKVNTNGATYVDYAIAQAAKFFTETTVSHTNGVADTVDLSTLGTVGMVIVKNTGAATNWLVWHRSLTSGNLAYLNLTNAQTADTSISVSGTTLTIASSLATGTYSVWAWAHDTAADGIIQCGSFTTDGSGNATVNLGWEPQFVMLRAASVASSMFMFDSARSLSMSTDPYLRANTSDEDGNAFDIVDPTVTGFNHKTINANQPSVYLAIRRGPMRAPTSGTQVYNAIARTGTGAAATVTGVGFPPDLVIGQMRGTGSGAPSFIDRLRGATMRIGPNATNAEAAQVDTLTAFGMDGIVVGTDGGALGFNYNATTLINHFFRRYPGVLDEVCNTGTGAQVALVHNLGVPPELIIRKSRAPDPGVVANYWLVGTQFGATNYKRLWLHDTGAASTYAYTAGSGFSDLPTATTFTVTGTYNASGTGYVTYLFATLAGVSKVGSYIGNGTSQTINCGFAAGARFVLIKRTDSTGDWYVWDSTRGIIAGNDPYLSLNTTAAEVTTDDSVDPDASGFIVNQVAATNINVNAGTYIYLAFA